MKKIFISFLILGLMLTTACGKKNNQKNDNPVVNKPTTPEKETSSNNEGDVVKDQTVDGLRISNVALKMDNGHSLFTADVINDKDTPDEVLSLNIIIKDGDGNEIITLFGYVGMTIEPHDSASITSGVDVDLTNAKSIEYTRNY